jgi:hypothetical protein
LSGKETGGAWRGEDRVMSGGEVMWPLGEMELAAASARGRLG